MDLLSRLNWQEAITSTNRAAGLANINGRTVDTEAHQGVAAIVEFGAISGTAVTALKWQGSDDDSTWVDLEGTKVVVGVTDDNQYFVTGLDLPVHRYVRLVVERATANAALRTAVYMLGRSRLSGLANEAKIENVSLFTSPAAGTA